MNPSTFGARPARTTEHFARLLLGLSFVGVSGAVAAPTTVGTVTVCYYSPECSFANVLGLPRALTNAESARDSGEHAGPPGASHTDSSTYTPVDAPAFQFTNTGTESITDAKFEIAKNAKAGVAHDVFTIGTIKPGASFVIVPGMSDDKKIHPSGGFFTYSGGALDTSDAGISANSIEFVFNGKVGTDDVTSGTIKVSASIAHSTDGTVDRINFLGGPGDADAPCDDCVAPKVIAKISTSAK